MKTISLTTLHIALYASALAGIVGPGSMIWAAVPFGSLLLWASVSDFQTFEIPDTASLLLALTGLTFRFSSSGLSVSILAEALIWPMLFLAAASIFRVLKGIHGLGFGDVKLVFGLSIWLGFSSTTLVVLAAAAAGILTLLIHWRATAPEDAPLSMTKLAFAPFLCLSAWVVWLRDMSL